MRRSFSVLAVVLLAFSLVACASRPETGFLSAVALSPPGAVDHTLLVATTRERDARPGTLFNGDRASAVDYAELTISVPPNHKQNEIEWASTLTFSALLRRRSRSVCSSPSRAAVALFRS